MADMCGDNRFEIIAKAKADLLEGTNIETDEAEMAVLDNILFRCWQMGWLDRYARKTEPSIDIPQGKWIPCSERLPDDIRPVIVTWKNNDPASYYQYIVGKHFIGVAHYNKGKWYWYSSVTEDLLAEYGKCDSEEFDEAIEAVAWMPLPKPYEADTPQTDCPWK